MEVSTLVKSKAGKENGESWVVIGQGVFQSVLFELRPREGKD